MDFSPIHFIGEPIDVEFDEPPLVAKKPPCPDRFTWRGTTYAVAAVLNEWTNFERRGRFTRNMRPTNQAKTVSRGSWGVGRLFFRVRLTDDRVFDLYYDREPQNADDRTGSWFLYREMAAQVKSD